jgi:hypothetical protein
MWIRSTLMPALSQKSLRKQEICQQSKLSVQASSAVYSLICVRTPEPKISSLSPLILEIDEIYTNNHLNTTKGMVVNSLEYKSVSKSALWANWLYEYRFVQRSVCVCQCYGPERNHGSTRVTIHAFLVWHSSWRCYEKGLFLCNKENLTLLSILWEVWRKFKDWYLSAI